MESETANRIVDTLMEQYDALKTEGLGETPFSADAQMASVELLAGLAEDSPTLRDRFAMAAPHHEIDICLLAAGEQKEIECVCRARYEWADAMLAAREKKI